MAVLIDFPLGFSAYTPDTFLSSILMSIFLLQRLHYKERPLTTPQKQLLHKVPFKSQQKRCEMGSLVNSKCKLLRKIISMQPNIYYFFREPFQYACRNISKNINLKEMLNHLSVKLRSAFMYSLSSTQKHPLLFYSRRLKKLEWKEIILFPRVL